MASTIVILLPVANYGQVPVSPDHHKCIECICQRAHLPAIRAAAVSALGGIGRMSLGDNQPERASRLAV